MRFKKCAMVILAAAVLSGAADAKGFNLFGGKGARSDPASRAAQQRSTAQPVNYRWSQGAAPQAYKDMVTQLGTRGLKPGHYVWASSEPASGEARVVLDL